MKKIRKRQDNSQKKLLVSSGLKNNPSIAKWGKFVLFLQLLDNRLKLSDQYITVKT